MIHKSLLDGFITQFDNLAVVVSESRNRVIADPADPLFYENQNVFIKSYLVSACSMLEAFIQDLAEAYTQVLRKRVQAANLPHNYVAWLVEHDKSKLTFASFKGRKTRKDLSDLISPNYFKTVQAFERIGVDIKSDKVSSYKDFVSSTVDKRNKVVHHNDSASDLSFLDVLTIISEFKAYASCLFDTVSVDPHVS